MIDVTVQGYVESSYFEVRGLIHFGIDNETYFLRRYNFRRNNFRYNNFSSNTRGQHFFLFKHSIPGKESLLMLFRRLFFRKKNQFE